MRKKHSPPVQRLLKQWNIFLDNFIALPAETQKEIIAGFKKYILSGKIVGTNERKIYETMTACLEKITVELS